MKTRFLFIMLAIIVIGTGIIFYFYHRHQQQASIQIGSGFNGSQAFQFAKYQVDLGPRTTGSKAHVQAVQWMQTQLQDMGWTVTLQNGVMDNHALVNVIAEKGKGKQWIVLGAHYDSRLKADQDRNQAFQLTPVPGADDGASGVAILLELAKTLPVPQNIRLTLVFFDAEDNGDIDNWDWLLGSEYYVSQLEDKPTEAIILDMVGDASLNIYKEKNSNQAINDSIWNEAATLGYGQQFVDQYKYSMLDDHTPFLKDGIPAVDIIDFDYPYWHTTQDSLDKISSQSLQIVGDTLWHWLINQ